MKMPRIAILFSGEGSNMENLIKQLKSNVTIEACITNNPCAAGIQKAQNLGVRVIVLDHTNYETREAFDQALVQTIQTLSVDLVVMAGFMRILTPVFTQAVTAINIHPSLLPKHKGANALKRSYESSDSEVGVTVHWVTSDLDAGEIILQKAIDKTALKTLASCERAIKALEQEIFPQAVIKALKTLM